MLMGYYAIAVRKSCISFCQDMVTVIRILCFLTPVLLVCNISSCFVLIPLFLLMYFYSYLFVLFTWTITIAPYSGCIYLSDHSNKRYLNNGWFVRIFLVYISFPNYETSFYVLHCYYMTSAPTIAKYRYGVLLRLLAMWLTDLWRETIGNRHIAI